MMRTRGMARESAWSATGGMASSALFRRGRGFCVARRYVMAAAVRREVGASERGLPRRILPAGTAALAAMSWIPPALAADGFDFSFDPASLAGIDIPGLIASNPNGAAVAAIGALLGAKGVALAVAALRGKVKGVRPSILPTILKAAPRVVVIDIRPKGGRSGGPAWGSYGKRAVSLPCSRADEKFGQKIARLRGVGDGALVVLVDAEGSVAPSAARQIAKAAPGVTSVCYVKGGAAGWKAAGMPWNAGLTLPSVKLPSVKLPAVSIDGIAESYRANPGAYNVGLGAGLAALSAALLISELDALLEVVGLLGFGQLFLRNMFFAEDRSRTIKKLREIRDEKIAVGSAGEDLRRLADALLDTKKGRTSAVRSYAPVANGAGSFAPEVSSPAADSPALGATPAVSGSAQ